MGFSNGTLGNGTLLSYSDVPAGSYTELGEIIDGQFPNVLMEKVDFTHTTSTIVENKPCKLPEYGDTTWNVVFLKAEYDTLEGFASAGTVKTWKITVDDTVGDQGGTCIFEGFIADLGVPKLAAKEKVTCSIKFTVTKWTGWTAAA